METDTRSESKAPAAAPELPVTFARWFQARGKERGFKAHWAAGMQAFTDTTKPHTMSEWDSIFKNY